MSRRCERGSATVHAAVFIGLLVTMAVVASAVAAVFVGHRRAASAADLAALAGASALQRGGAGCGAAASIAEENAARLVGCVTDGEVVTVRVSVDVPTLVRSSFEVRSRARAGPAP